jgi:ABC-type branched-subunit amino acid transport system ATPase component
MSRFTFKVVSIPRDVPLSAVSEAFLISDNWDDWGMFETMYSLVAFDEEGTKHDFGSVKIGQFDLLPGRPSSKVKRGTRWASIPNSFKELGQECFSLGQSEKYYETLGTVSDPLRKAITSGLRDLVANHTLWKRARRELVATKSLLREVTPTMVEGQFRRLLAGGLMQTPFSFAYQFPSISRNSERPELTFHVSPESLPPTNIHVLIGSNGTGKTSTLNNMVKCLLKRDGNTASHGRFNSTDKPRARAFSNLVSVSFSAFDNFDVADNSDPTNDDMRYVYVGLKEWAPPPKRANRPMSPEKLAREFAASVGKCIVGPRKSRWDRAIETLESDPVFRDKQLRTTLAANQSMPNEAAGLFDQLSAGHKVVLLTITRLVETVEEKTLVLIDEPECHLHPPLLSAFVRALSELLTNRNGVAIIATHSPVILQEVPRTCVWKLVRTGDEIIATRPEIETFGENVGVLTRDIFALEIRHVGFNNLLSTATSTSESYNDVAEKFSHQLGSEARAILRSLVSQTAEDV